MRRREFITLLGGAAATWPIGARGQQAQQANMPVIGILGSSTAAAFAPRLAAFMQGLKETGFVEGQNFTIESRWANDRYDLLPEMAGDLVRREVSLILAVGNNLPAHAAKSATNKIPIVFSMGADPVQLGLVASLARPAGNITGVTSLGPDQVQKRMQLLHDVAPNAKLFGVILNPDNLGSTSSAGRNPLQTTQNAAEVLGVKVEVAYVRAVGDLAAAVENLVKNRIEALVTQSDAMFTANEDRLVALAAKHAMPAVFGTTEAARAGGLVSYTASRTDGYHQAGRYAGRILKGERPADLPVLLPTKFEFAINLKTPPRLV
jgi:putative ABC transport system substrate-binding protein